jgi:short-subunit dehydrogenase
MAIMSTNHPRQTALVTGASSGIGAALARLFAENGYDLVIVARSQKALQDLADDLSRRHGANVTVVPLDLSLAGAPGELMAALQRQAIQIDVLVNNAGFATYGLFAEIDLKIEQEMMQVNMVTLTHLTKLLLPGMIQRRQGRVLNVASTAAFQPGPLMAVYYATKAYVLLLSEALAEELRGTGVSVTVLCPGPTRSGFQERAKMEDSRLVQGQIMDVDTVARAGYNALMANKRIVIPGRQNQLLAFATRLLPRNFVTRLARQAQERVHTPA